MAVSAGQGGSAGVTVHSQLSGLLVDDHTQYLLLAGRAGGQTAIGGTGLNDSLVLEATSNAGGGLVETNHPLRLNYTEGNTSGEQSGMIWEPTFTTAGAYLGQMIRNDADITYTNSFYIYASVLDRSIHRSNAAAGFQAFTLFNALCIVTRGTSNDLVQQIILNDGGVHENTVAVSATATQHVTVSSAPQLRATVSGATMTWSSGAKGLTFAPKFSSVAGSTINLGTLCAVQCVTPAAALFQPGAGTNNATAYYGMDFPNITFATSGDKVVIRSAMTDAADRFFLQNNGGARSSFGDGQLRDCGQILQPTDLVGRTLGAGADFQDGWAAGNFYFWQFNGLADQLRFSNPSADRYLFDTNGGNTVSEFNFNCHSFSLGAQTGAVGNQVGAFVAGTRSVSVAGEWSDFLLTQAGNITINAAMTGVFGWTVNAPSMTLGTGSVTTSAALNVGGNPNQGTNRYGHRVISNPSGGTLNYCARFEGLAGVRVDGIFEHTGSTLGVYGTAPVAQPTVTGSRAGNAALASLLTSLASQGIIVDSSSA